MKNDPIIECQKIEAKGKKKIIEAEKEVASMITKAKQEGQKKLDQVEIEVQTDAKAIQADLKKKISDLASQGRKEIDSQMSSLEKAKEKNFPEAVELVVKKII